MGSIVTLGVGDFEVDWAKNFIGTNHSSLFRACDLSEAVYHYADEITEVKPAYVRNLGCMVRRLELLGYSLARCRTAFEDVYSAHPHVGVEEQEAFSWDEFFQIIKRLEVENFPINEDCDSYPSKFVRREILENFNEFHVPGYDAIIGQKIIDKFANAEILQNLDPNVLLRLLAENPSNRDKPVIWRHYDILEGGYAHDSEIFTGLDQKNQVLIVTEGSSDADILLKSARVVCPDIDDFFYFVDMKEHYPFTGTGSVVNFIKGLSRIRILNRVLVILDNDAAGRTAARSLSQVGLPPNIALMVLPDLPSCRSVRTVGPSGESIEDVNGKAVAIEFFLDHSPRPPVVRWQSFNKELGIYHGVLENKDVYTRYFHDSLGNPDYDTSNLKVLWDKICNVTSEFH